MTLKIISRILVLAALTAGCAATPEAVSPDALPLASLDSPERSYRETIASAPWTVFVFVSATCPCLDAHLGRLRELSHVYGRRGVQFIAVDSEVGTTKESARAEAKALGLSFPLLVDGGAKLANALDAQYATYSVIVDRRGKIVYRGGIDSDKRKLHADATPYVRDALDDVLAGILPRRPFGKALGCILRKW
jgi:peroxiredoxin